MGRYNIGIISKIVLVIAVFASFSIFVYPYIACNGAGGAYGGTDGNTDGKRIARTSNLESYIIEGGAYFLESKASMQKILKIVELNGRDGITSGEFRVEVNNAITNMENAAAIYDLLIRTAEVTPYNSEVTKKLKAFDYTGYYWRSNLNYSVFHNVQFYLRSGDVTGVFRKTQLYFKEILKLLISISDGIYDGRYPEIMDFRNMNEKAAEVSLFSSYVARMFEEIK